jgi:transcriptional regulator with XRE-family HTH domain
VRLRRKLLGRSQECLAEILGVSFQQIQKYERGTNRISASKLYKIAATLQVSVTFFFEGLAPTDQKSHPAADQRGAEVSAFVASPDGLDWARAVSAIPSPGLRRRVLELAQGLAGEDA